MRVAGVYAAGKAFIRTFSRPLPTSRLERLPGLRERIHPGYGLSSADDDLMNSPVPPRAPHLPEQRFTARRIGRLAVFVLVLAIPCAIALFILFTIVRDVRAIWNRYALDHHGISATGRVVSTREDDTWNEEGQFFVTVAFGQLDQSAEVEVNSDSHPVGSEVEIHYDPTNPRRAIAVEDSPTPAGLGSFYLVLILLGLVGASFGRSRRWRSRRTKES